MGVFRCKIKTSEVRNCQIFAYMVNPNSDRSFCALLKSSIAFFMDSFFPWVLIHTKLYLVTKSTLWKPKTSQESFILQGCMPAIPHLVMPKLNTKCQSVQNLPLNPITWKDQWYTGTVITSTALLHLMDQSSIHMYLSLFKNLNQRQV